MLLHGKQKPNKPKSIAKDSSTRRRGRSWKRTSELAVSRKLVNLHAEKLHKIASTTSTNARPSGSSSLEDLPAEIIQQIFFWSLEINLPRCSTYLSNSLSLESIFKTLILFAFFDDDGFNPVEKEHFKPAEYRLLSIEEKLRLQAGILECKWCTLERIQSWMPVLSRLKMVQALNNEKTFEQEMVAELGFTNTTYSDSDEIPSNLIALPDLKDDEALTFHFLARQDQFSNYEYANGTVGPTGKHDFLPQIMIWGAWTIDEGTISKLSTHGVSIFTARVIPEKILMGNPWDERKVRLLQLLRQGYRYLNDQPVLVISGNALFKGMSNAIIERKVDILRILLEFYCAITRIAPFETRQRRTTGLSRPKTCPLPLHLFHQAVQQGSSSSSLLSLLIRADVDAIPLNDQILANWAMQTRKSDDQLGVWLSKHMDGSIDYRLRKDDSLFINGRLSDSMRYDICPFSDRSFTSEIGYITTGARNLMPTDVHGEPFQLMS